MRERSNGMEGIGDVQDATLGLVVQVQALRQKVARLIRLMREAGELPEEKAEGLLELIAGPLEEQEPDSEADMTGAALPEAGVEAPLGAAGGDARPRAPSRRRTARMDRNLGAAQDPEDGGSQA
ncbi:hypothetical protein [Thermoflexus sp.]|jgi:hypothetical protein|uniref:hypothetical protein n=1 Tax=Thermoflexus sp. TaxID=1969742 RepID=UPI003C094431